MGKLLFGFQHTEINSTYTCKINRDLPETQHGNFEVKYGKAYRFTVIKMAGEEVSII